MEIKVEPPSPGGDPGCSKNDEEEDWIMDYNSEDEGVDIQVLSQADSEAIMSNMRSSLAEHSKVKQEAQEYSGLICGKANCERPLTKSDEFDGLCEICYYINRSTNSYRSYSSSEEVQGYVRSKRGRPPAQIDSFPPEYGSNPRERNNLASMMSRRKKRMEENQLDQLCKDLLARNVQLQEEYHRRQKELETYQAACARLLGP
jgi:hypothetical protein